MVTWSSVWGGGKEGVERVSRGREGGGEREEEGEGIVVLVTYSTRTLYSIPYTLYCVPTHFVLCMLSSIVVVLQCVMYRHVVHSAID